MYIGSKNIKGSDMWSNFSRNFKISNTALLESIQYVCSYIQTYSEQSDGKKKRCLYFLDQFQNSLRKSLRSS